MALLRYICTYSTYLRYRLPNRYLRQCRNCHPSPQKHSQQVISGYYFLVPHTSYPFNFRVGFGPDALGPSHLLLTNEGCLFSEVCSLFCHVYACLLLRRRFSLGGKRVGARHTRLGNNSLAECLSSVFSPFHGASRSFCCLMGKIPKTLFPTREIRTPRCRVAGPRV